MMEWKEVRLGDIYDVHNGLSKGGKFFGSGFPFLTFSVVFNNYFVPEELSSLVQSTEKERLSCSIKAGDVFITRTSETAEELGMSCVALKDYPNATYNGFTKRLRKKDDCQYEVDSRYIGYYLRSRKFRSLFMGLSGSMSTRASLANGDLLNMPVSLPSLSNQRRIASILSSLDKKIETNNKINANLEEMAQAIFKNWFVDFAPFKDGKFVESELGMIPEGWRVGTLSDITQNLSIKVGKRDDVKVLSPVTTGELMLSEEYFTKQVFSASIAKYKVVKQGDFAYNPARVNIGSLGRNEFDFDGCVSPVYIVFSVQHGYENFFDLLRRTENFKSSVQSRAIGGVRQSLNYEDFGLIDCVIPSLDSVEAFNKIYDEIKKMKKHNDEESSRLASIRDTLLPRLMSGEIEV